MTRTVMVGDRHYDIDGGRAHGLRTIGVTWGYGTPDELRTSGADHIVIDPSTAPRRALVPPP